VRLRSRRPGEELLAIAGHETALSGAVQPEHVLVAAMLCNPDLEALLGEYGVDVDDVRDRIALHEHDALASLGISLESIEREVEDTFGPLAWRRVDCVEISPEVKRALAEAAKASAPVHAHRALAALLAPGSRLWRFLVELDVPPDEIAARLRR
jgi:hypothetical protein